MPAPTLTPDEALLDYQLTVTHIDLADAAEQIYTLTGYTLAEHVDTRRVYIGNVRRAWAIVASRVRSRTVNDAAHSVTGETDEGYSYSTASSIQSAASLNLLAGVPNGLLNMGSATWEPVRGDMHRVPPERDDYGVTFVTTR